MNAHTVFSQTALSDINAPLSPKRKKQNETKNSGTA